MWLKRQMPLAPPMTGNGKHTTYKNGDDWGMVQMSLFYPHSWEFNMLTNKGWELVVNDRFSPANMVSSQGFDQLLQLPPEWVWNENQNSWEILHHYFRFSLQLSQFFGSHGSEICSLESSTFSWDSKMFWWMLPVWGVRPHFYSILQMKYPNFLPPLTPHFSTLKNQLFETFWATILLSESIEILTLVLKQILFCWWNITKLERFVATVNSFSSKSVSFLFFAAQNTIAPLVCSSNSV